MCTRLHAIGFPCAMDRSTATFLAEAATTARRRVTCPDGEYRVWRSRAGAEIWMHYPKRRSARPMRAPRPAVTEAAPRTFDPIDDLMGLSVAHAGASDVRMRLARSIRVADNNPLDGVCVATLPSTRAGDKPISFSFELLGYAAERAATGHEARVQLTGLAQKVWAYESESAYLAGTPSRRLIGKGSMTDVSGGEVPDLALTYRQKPGTLWLVTGEVRRSIRLVNPVTKAPYYWVHLLTDRGEIDLVSSPDVITGDISDGHTVQAAVAMTGRILERLS